jgi:site-specific DNA-methyltransferase (adenine-specific)
MTDEAEKIVCGDCLDVMRDLPDACVDAIVTDPPYGLVANKKGGSGIASVNLDSPYGRARIGTGNGSGGFMGKAWDSCVPGVEFWAEALRVAKPGAHLVAFGGTRTYHRLAVAIEDAGWEIRDCLSWLYGSGFPKSLDVSKAIDKAAGAEREVLVTAPTTDAAKQWQGWGTALKPAWEPCILARKPLVGTVAANVLAHGTGAINVDACRIESGPSPSVERRKHAAPAMSIGATGWTTPARPPSYNEQRGGEALGRWPANVALDEEAAAMLDEQTGERKSGIAVQRNGGGGLTYGGKRHATMRNDDWGYSDSGGASRFFYTAKASRAERTMRSAVDNKHPTVKPVSLMRWLVRLVTPPQGSVLDPFAGSGTTLLAAHLEGFDYLGIEREAEYVEIIRERLRHAETLRDSTDPSRRRGKSDEGKETT